MSDLKYRLQRQRQKIHVPTKTDHLSNRSLIFRINWFNCSFVFGLPLLALYGLCTLRQFVWQTWLWAAIFYLWSGLGITAGYHRLWSHASFTASKPLAIFLMIGGSGALQRSIQWWCLLHRAHHRWTDTELDPYNAQRGFFYSHVGWLLLDKIRIKKHVNIQDLRDDPIARWQHKNFDWFGPFIGFVFPTLVAYLFCNGDVYGGFYIAGVLRVVLIHHATYSINSLAHILGSKTFDDTISARDSIITSLCTLGEGYHNFHHEFPHDYRNGIKWWNYDPTKWFIYAMKCLGAAHDLNRFPANEIEKGELDMIEKRLIQRKQGVTYGLDIASLPMWTKHQFELETNKAKKNSRILIIASGIVYDATQFVDRHPGGEAIITQRHGNDVTKDFNGNVYNHTNAARNLMSHLRIARIKDLN
eukprot:654033_1